MIRSALGSFLLFSVGFLAPCGSLGAEIIHPTSTPGTSPAPPKNRVRKEKFAEVIRASKTLKANSDLGMTIPRFDELVRKFATEIEMLPAPKADKELIAIDLYKKAFRAYRDSLELWKASQNTESYDLVPTDFCRVLTYEIQSKIGVGRIIDEYHLGSYLTERNKNGGRSDVERYLYVKAAIPKIWAVAQGYSDSANEWVE